MTVLESQAQTASSHRLDGLRAARDYGVVIGVVVLFIVLSISSGPFLTKANLLNLFDQSAYVGIIACAGTFVVISGCIDLSVASIFALAGVVAAEVSLHANPWLGLLAGIVAGGAAGAINGAIVMFGRVNSLIATIASALVFTGIADIATNGQLITPSNQAFGTIGVGSFISMTYTSWAFVAVAIVLWFVLARSRFGRHVYASGGNADAARLSGLLVGRIRTATFVLSGLAAGLAGVLSASRIGDGQSDAGTNLQITALTAVFIGGTSLSGGSGSVWRTIVGVFLLTLINNGFDLLGINPIYETIVQGLIILVAVSADAWSRRSTSTGVTA
jgi:ribose transport system permease protein